MIKYSELKQNNKLMRIIFITVTTLLVAAVIALSVAFGIYFAERQQLRKDIDNIYQSSYYELVTNVLDIENGLAKLSVMRSEGLIRETLESVSVNSERASVCLSALATRENNMNGLLRFVNQTGDYSKHLIRRLGERGELEKGEYETAAKLSQAANKLSRVLAGMQDKIDEGYSFIQMLGKQGDSFSIMLSELENGSVEYPSLIYDGPFSDGLSDREAKGISGEELSAESAQAELAKYLIGYDIITSKLIGENNYRIPSYLFEVELAGGRYANVQLSKRGGSLLMLDIFKNVDSPELSVEECVELAQQYCSNIGLKDMKAVWQSNNNSTVYVNLCYTKDDIVYYPDLIKIKVCMDTGEITGFEGLNYAYNHTQRTLDTPQINEEEAVLQTVSLTDMKVRLTLIPYTVMQERLCYEISGYIADEYFFIYVDAKSGEEIKVLRLIDSNQGELLL